MSSTPPHIETRRRSPNMSSSSSTASESTSAIPPSLSLLPNTQNMSGDRRRGRPHSQSDTSMLRTFEAGHSNTGLRYGNAAGENRSGISPGAIASHFPGQPNDAHGEQTWMDFLRVSGADDSSNAPVPSHSNTSLPAELHRHTSSSSRYSLPNQRSSHSRHSETSSVASRSSTERKRRLTTAESPLRRPSILRSSSSSGPLSSQPGAVSSELTALDGPSPSRISHRPSPSLPTHPSRSSSNFGQERHEERRESDIVLPAWQPDSDVNYCPVCGSQFTFFYRKHHCRKCGRVVCSACSPHRITIPRQFIVRPPSEELPGLSIMEYSRHNSNEDEEADENSSQDYRPNPALGGGEEVRVCNPCVPDPNYHPPPQYQPNYYGGFGNGAFGGYPPQLGGPYPGGNSPYSSNAYQSSNIPRPEPTRGHHGHRSTLSTPNPNWNSGANDVPTGNGSHLRGPPRFGHPNQVQPHIQAPAYLGMPPHATTMLRHHATQQPPQDPRNPGMYMYSGFPGATPQHGGILPMFRPSQPVAGFDPSAVPQSMTPQQLDASVTQRPLPAQPTPVAAPPRRQIAEEDECPVCGEELPPMGPEGDDSQRVEHINDCIATYSNSPPPVATSVPTSTSLPAQRSRGMSTTGSPTTSGPSNRASMNLSARGMVPYIASEKDCVDEDGGQSECVICMEDLEAGDKMARLVCWCKFHEHCIRDWWDRKGRGSCPTHQVSDVY